ncbi:MAG: DUF3857 domain-containing protein [Ferruginibacter sp.]
MKKIILYSFLMLLTASGIQAQKNVSPFGKIDVEDLKMLDVSFDPGAEAVVLFDVGNVYYDRGTQGITWFKTMYNRRTRIKILKDKGMSYANVEIPFYNYNNDEKITNIEAVTYNLDENGKVKTTDVSKSSIYIKKINRRYSRLVIAFPEVKPGSVIEYKYKLERETWTDLKTWYFQSSIPTRYSEFEFEIPGLFRFEALPNIVDNIDVKSKVSRQSVDISGELYDIDVIKKTYVMKNLVGIKREPFSPALKDYHQRLEFQLSQLDFGNGNVKELAASWKQRLEDLNKFEDFGQQLEKNLVGTETILSQASIITNEREKIKYIFNAVRKKMSLSYDESIYTDEGISKAWNNGQGNNAEINFILINLLNKIGIKAMPILLSTRDHGVINPSYTFLSQFNAVMAYVPASNGYYILDATNKTIPYPLIPREVVSTKGLILQQPAGRWIDLIDNSHKYRVTTILQETIDENGLITGTSTINYDDYAKSEKQTSYLKDPAAYKDVEVVRPYPSVNITKVDYVNADKDSLGFSQVVNFTSQLTKTGDYYYFNQNVFTEFLSSPFIDDSRLTDIDYGFQQEYIIYTNVKIPEGFIFESYPKSIVLQTADRSVNFSRVSGDNGNMLNLKIDINFKRNFYTPEQYPDFKEFYKAVIKNLNEQIVMKKK